jgi:hypothetical protein
MQDKKFPKMFEAKESEVTKYVDEFDLDPKCDSLDKFMAHACRKLFEHSKQPMPKEVVIVISVADMTNFHETEDTSRVPILTTTGYACLMSSQELEDKCLRIGRANFWKHIINQEAPGAAMDVLTNECNKLVTSFLEGLAMFEVAVKRTVARLN